MRKFALQNNHTNIIAVTTPHRHDFPNFSCVNKETQVFSRKLHKLLNEMYHTSVVDTDITGDKFIWHGLHMNPSGRKRILKIKGHTITTTSTSEIPPFSLKWEEVPLATSTVETKMGSTSKNDDGVHRIVARSSSSPKRLPLTRNEDFFIGIMLNETKYSGLQCKC